MSMQTIVVAVIAIVVMIIVISIFSGNILKSNDGFQSCATSGGKCVDVSCDEIKDDKIYVQRSGNFSDCKSPKSCCMRVG
jgi:hypothetical protein